MNHPFGLMADLHLHPWSSFSSVDENGVNSRLSSLFRELHRCASEVKNAGGNTIVMAGDVFHVRGSVSPIVLNSTKDTLRAIHEETGVKFIIIPGNHDLEGKETTRLGSAVTALECDWVQIANESTFFPALGAILVPWVEGVGPLKEELKRLAPAKPSEINLIIHAPIDGVIPGLPAHGLDPEFLASLGFRHVFAGHYHHHKAFHGGVVSIGALAHHTWSDVASKAGFLIVDPQAGSYKWFKSHLPEFIDITRMVEIDPEEIPLIVDGNFVRVRVEASKTKDVDAARTELFRMGAKAVLVQAEPKRPAGETREATAGAIKAGSSLAVSVTGFVEHDKSLKGVKSRHAVAVAALDVLNAVASAA